MTAWGYGFYLLVLKVSLTRERYFHHSKIKFLSPRGHVISSIYSDKVTVKDVYNNPKQFHGKYVLEHTKCPSVGVYKCKKEKYLGITRH